MISSVTPDLLHLDQHFPAHTITFFPFEISRPLYFRFLQEKIK